MPRKSPFLIELSTEEAAELNRRATRYTLPYFEVVRAKMIQMAADGIGNDEIAGRLARSSRNRASIAGRSIPRSEQSSLSKRGPLLRHRQPSDEASYATLN